MTKICFGCGAKLQSYDVEKEGYIPEDKKDSSQYCQRCFKIINYGMQSKSSTPKETDTIIDIINHDNKFVVFLVDFLSINTKVFDIYKRINKPKLLVISKCDLILKNIRREKIISFIKNYYQIKEDIKLISSLNNYGVEALTDYLEDREIDYIYFVGLTNSGKSSLINKLIELNDTNLNQLTTSYIPNTTLDFIRIKIKDNLTVIDSPGFIIDTIQDDLILKKYNLKVCLKPKTFQMKTGETLEIENMYFNFSDDTSVTLYMANDLRVRKYYKPVTYEYRIDIGYESDLIVSGLGFLNIKKSCVVRVANIKANLIEVRSSILGG